MEQNIILAGVGGQGILTVAQAISSIAVERGWHVRQSEVHGMAQRGGAVQAHLRFGPHEIWSDLVPVGEADMILAVEPLEALRYTDYLARDGCIIAGANPFVNIPNYPPIEEVLDRVCAAANHVLLDATRLARAAGSARAVNMVMLGAASRPLELTDAELESAIRAMFTRKGESVVTANIRACALGRRAAEAYIDGISRGIAPRRVRAWVDTLTPDTPTTIRPPWSAGATGGDARPTSTGGDARPTGGCPWALSDVESNLLREILDRVRSEDRRQLYEHEVYRIVELVGAVSPPMHELVRPSGTGVSARRDNGRRLVDADLARFPGERVVLKLVSQDVVHKTEARAVAFVPKDANQVSAEIARLIAQAEDRGARVEGVLVVECVTKEEAGFGGELFVGIRATREFGPIIAAGIGGVDTEYLASLMKPGAATAKALAGQSTPEAFFDQFRRTAAYEVLSGAARGHRRVITDGQLLRCFRTFMAIATEFCVHRGPGEPELRELEVNPFAFRGHRMVPLDGRGRLGEAPVAAPPRPVAKIAGMLEPTSIALVGVSSKRRNFGRIILENIIACGFDKRRMYVVKPDDESILGVPCVPAIGMLPEPVDLLVVTTPSDQVEEVIDEVTRTGRAESVILVPGGAGETPGTADTKARLRERIAASRARPGGGPIVLGPNCLGVRSKPGRFDTFFIPEEKLDPRRSTVPGRMALIAQSGGFIITRMSNLDFLDPAICVSLGNQIDLTVSDLLRGLGDREDIDCIGVYVEGFNDLDGERFVRAVEDVVAAGKLVIFYKAGRTAQGQEATAGHTASLAGDYDVCQAAIAQAGALVTDTFKEFEQLIQLGTALHNKQVAGRRIGVVTNAGFEAVGMADAISGARYQVEIPALGDVAVRRISDALARAGINELVNVRNPLDITPMAGEDEYDACVRAMVEDEGIDAVIVSIVPMTPRLRTTADEIQSPGSLADRLPALAAESNKPIIAVIDSGTHFDPLVRAMTADRVTSPEAEVGGSAGMVVFRSSDQAVRSLGRYLCHRAGHPEPQQA